MLNGAVEDLEEYAYCRSEFSTVHCILHIYMISLRWEVCAHITGIIPPPFIEDLEEYACFRSEFSKLRSIIGEQWCKLIFGNVLIRRIILKLMK
jgi:hypothetical protein